MSQNRIEHIGGVMKNVLSKASVSLICILFGGCNPINNSNKLPPQENFGQPTSQQYNQTPTFTDESPQLVEQRQRQVLKFSPDDHIEKTVIPGIYALRSPQASKFECTSYVTSGGSIILNRGKWVYSHDIKQPVPNADVLQIQRHIYANLPDNITIDMSSKGKPSAMSMFSAIGCSLSAKMEADLKKNRIDYRIIPSRLTPEIEPLIRYAVCSVNPMTAWQAIRSGKVTLANVKQPTQCRVDYRPQDIRDIECMTPGISRYPQALFSDGTMPYSGELVNILKNQ